MSDRPRVLIVGAAGQVGTELQRSFSDFATITAVDRKGMDLGVPEQIRDEIRRLRPEVILNAAAYTAVDRAESEPELAMAINAAAPRVLAEEARNLNALLVHYSTDYVFDGSRDEAWTEREEPHPLSVYGASKLAGEEAIRQVGGRYLIFRTSWVYGVRGKNFLLTMLQLGRERDELSVVDDQFGAPTTAAEIARGTRAVVGGVVSGQFGQEKDWAGLYHMTCGGETTWCGFARAIFAGAEPQPGRRWPEVEAISTSGYPTAAKRPRNSVLSNAKLEGRFGVRLKTWGEGLEEVLQLLSTGHDVPLQT